MATHRGLKALFLCALALTLSLGGCGRRGALDVPGAAARAPAATAQAGPAAEQPAEPRSFPLDFLIR